jgi:hypothetical protein
MNEVAHRDLSWFWTSWFEESWFLDQALGGVATSGDSTEITVEDRGLAPMPPRLRVTRVDGSTRQLELSITPWLRGERSVRVRVPATPAITKIELDPEQLFPDVNRENDTWTKPK